MLPVFYLCLLCGALDQPADAAAIREHLKPLNGLVGTWKGTAQPQERDSKRRRLFWKEESSWVWVLSKEQTGLSWLIKGSKLVEKGFLSWSPEQKKIFLDLALAGGETVKLTGAAKPNRFTAEGTGANGDRWRLSVVVANENRFTYTLERSPSGSEGFVPVVETGNTRAGVQFAAGSTGPDCIVTGGKATITVTYKGKTYYVCCSGCKDAFEADPESFIHADKKKNP